MEGYRLSLIPKALGQLEHGQTVDEIHPRRVTDTNLHLVLYYHAATLL